MSAQPRTEEFFTLQWRLFLLLRRLGMKSLAHSLFKDAPRSTVYVDGRLRGSTRIKAVDLDRAAKALLLMQQGTEPPPPTEERPVAPDLLNRP